MSAVVAADRRRVWQALTRPEEILAWDENSLGAVDPELAYPEVGEAYRWRYKLGSTAVVMRDTPRAVRRGALLESTLRAGSLRLERTYTLFDEGEEGEEPRRTRLAMKLIAENTVPVMGDVIDRFDVRRMTVERIDESLRAVQKWCEQTA